MWQGPGTSYDHGMKNIRRQPLPLVPTPEIQALLMSFLPFASFHGPPPQRERVGSGSLLPHPCLGFQKPSFLSGSLWCQLFSLLLPPQRHRMLLPGSSPPTHPTQPWGHPCLCPSLQHQPRPPAPAPGSQLPFNKHISAQVWGAQDFQ